MHVAVTLKAALEESQDWNARAAQEVAAARARGADLEALVHRKERRAEFLRMKAERSQAAKAEVPTQHLPAFSGMAPVLSRDFC